MSASNTEMVIIVIRLCFFNLIEKFIFIGKPTNKGSLGIKTNMLNAESFRFLVTETKAHQSGVSSLVNNDRSNLGDR